MDPGEPAEELSVPKALLLAMECHRGGRVQAAAEVYRLDSFDLVVSADTLCYCGDLGPVFASAIESVHPGGWLVLTLEAAESPLRAGRPHARCSR